VLKTGSSIVLNFLDKEQIAILSPLRETFILLVIHPPYNLFGGENCTTWGVYHCPDGVFIWVFPLQSPFWGASFIATKIALRALMPASITVLRFGIGSLLIAVVLLFQGKGKFVKLKDLPMLALLGFLGVPFHQWLQVTGLKTASATVGSWIVATTPVFVAILGWLVLKEKFGQKRVLGIMIATLGALIVVGQGNPLDLLFG